MADSTSEAIQLFRAAKAGDLPSVQKLLAADAALVAVRDDDGATALHHAAYGGHQEISRYLVEQGADVNARDGRFDATPAGWAIEYLRELGGFLAIEIEDMVFAIRQGDVGWVRRFLARLPALARCKDADGKPLIQYAGECGVPEIAEMFERASRR
jgi:hypothetical protein